MHGLPSEVHYNIYEVATTVFSMCVYGCAPDGSGIMQFIIHTYPGSVRACNAITCAHHMLYKKKTQVITFTMANYSNKIFPPPHTNLHSLRCATEIQTLPNAKAALFLTFDATQLRVIVLNATSRT